MIDISTRMTAKSYETFGIDGGSQVSMSNVLRMVIREGLPVVWQKQMEEEWPGVDDE